MPDKYILADATNPQLPWTELAKLDIPVFYAGSYMPIGGGLQREYIAYKPREAVNFIISNAFCIISDRDILDGFTGDTPYYHVTNANELDHAIEEAVALWQTLH